MTRRGRLHQRRRPHVPIGTPLAGRRVTLRFDGTLLQVIEDAILLRSLPFPLTAAELVRVRGSRPAGPAPQPAAELLRVERRVSCRGAIMVAKQRIHVGIQHAGKTVAVEVDDGTFTRPARPRHPARRRPDQPQGGRPIQRPQARSSPKPRNSMTATRPRRRHHRRQRRSGQGTQPSRNSVPSATTASGFPHGSTR
jgi:hypothetical protein